MNHRPIRSGENEWGCLDCDAEPTNRAWGQPCLRVIEERFINRDRIVRSTICDGSWRPPIETTGDHGICTVCAGPFRLDMGRVPSHHRMV